MTDADVTTVEPTCCHDCPFVGDSHCVEECDHPDLTARSSPTISLDKNQGRPPPEWCPLRKSAILVRLKAE